MILRPIALFLGVFTLLNVVLDLVVPGFDANLWWVDFRPLPGPLPGVAAVVTGVALLAYAALGVGSGGPDSPSAPPSRFALLPRGASSGSPSAPPSRFALLPRGASAGRRVLAVGLVPLVVFVAHNTVQFYVLLLRGDIDAGFPVPLSLFLLVPALAIFHRVAGPLWRRGRSAGSLAGQRDPWTLRRAPWRERAVAAAALGVTAVAFPLAQMVCFGSTDYRRPAAVAVVFGAKTYASGQMSTSLYDRARTGVELYQQGLVDALVFSGGPGDGAIHETEAMRRYALEQGVPDPAIIRDELGLDTQSTVRNTVALFRERGYASALAVSQFYHLPRIKLTYLRAGFEVYTVPARRSQYIPGTPYFMARETAALWFYYFRPLLPGR